MDTKEIIKRLKNPEKYRQAVVPQKTEAQPEAAPVPVAPKNTLPEKIIAGVVVGLIGITLWFWVMSKNRAEDLTAALEPEQLQGLALDEEFNPNTDVTYVEVREGQDRNVAVSNLGSTLPIISRFNLNTLTDKNYEIIGAAPWALTTNFESNIADPEIIRYLLNNETMINAFLNRQDVAPLLEDPKLLASLTEDQKAMQEFFTNPTVQAVLANEQMVRTVAGSRFMSYLLVSQAVKYYREHPQEALAIIRANPYLEAVRTNPYVQTAVKENPYLKKLADVLLATKSATRAASSATKATAKTGSKTGAKTGTKTKSKTSSQKKTTRSTKK